jgi:glyoxylase-like metal-dependent hydrolase (beta-lactamase superfamily II)
MSEFEPGRLVRVAHAVQRLVAPNPSMMTGPGTNAYLLGDPPTVVIDPGPAHPQHVAALHRAAPGLALIFVTHTHADHSPAAAPLARLTGARIVGRASPQDGRQDATFVPQLEPAAEQRFELACGTLRSIHTPGHASNHVCYLLEEQGLLFSGDHVLDGVTPVIMPPDGSMSEYLASLAHLRTYALRAIAPGHGRLLREPLAVIDGVLAHRARREAKVLTALERAGCAGIDELLAVVYDDVPAERHAFARLSLEAHLIKLMQEGRCERAGDSWCRTTSKRH